MGNTLSGAPGGDVTVLLKRWADGDAQALNALTPLLYAELKRLAHHYLQNEDREPILQTTALVHEAYLRLIGLDVSWEGRSHFIAVSARLMRRVLVDRARRRLAGKRGDGQQPLSLDDVVGAQAARPEEVVLNLHDALSELERVDARKHRILELKYFGGATVAEISTLLELSHRTVERELRLGRALLAQSLDGEAPP